jgi:hypothetical protein
MTPRIPKTLIKHIRELGTRYTVRQVQDAVHAPATIVKSVLLNKWSEDLGYNSYRHSERAYLLTDEVLRLQKAMKSININQYAPVMGVSERVANKLYVAGEYEEGGKTELSIAEVEHLRSIIAESR